MEEKPALFANPKYLMWSVAIALVVIFGVLAFPSIVCGPMRIDAVSYAKMIYLATFQMAADYEADQDPRKGWPGDLAASPVEPVHSLPEFFERLVALDYMKREDLPVLLTMPGYSPKYDGHGPLSAEHSPFKIYLARGADPSDTLFLATRNFASDRTMDDVKTRIVIMRKGGDAYGFASGKQLENAKLRLLLPGADVESAKSEKGKVWK